MKSLYNKINPMTNKKIYDEMMKAKSIIDTIREEKSLDDSHDLSLASNHLDNFLNALEEQGLNK